MAWCAGIGGPRAVTRRLLSGPLRIGPVDGGGEARCALLLRDLTTAMAATVAMLVMAVASATMAMAVASSVMAAKMGRSRGGGAESRSMRGTDARGGGAEEWHVSRR